MLGIASQSPRFAGFFEEAISFLTNPYQELIFKRIGLINQHLESLLLILKHSESLSEQSQISRPTLLSPELKVKVLSVKKAIDEYFNLSPEEMKAKANDFAGERKTPVPVNLLDRLDSTISLSNIQSHFKFQTRSSTMESQTHKFENFEGFKQLPSEEFFSDIAVYKEDGNLNINSIVLYKCMRLPAFRSIMNETFLKKKTEKQLIQEGFQYQKNFMDFPYFFDFKVQTPQGEHYLIVDFSSKNSFLLDSPS